MMMKMMMNSNSRFDSINNSIVSGSGDIGSSFLVIVNFVIMDGVV